MATSNVTMNSSKNVARVYAKAAKLNDDELSVLVDQLESLKSRRVLMYNDYPTMLNHWCKMNRVDDMKYENQKKQDYYIVTLAVGTMFYQDKCKTRKELKEVRKRLAKQAYEDAMKNTESKEEATKKEEVIDKVNELGTIDGELGDWSGCPFCHVVGCSKHPQEMAEGTNGDSLPFDGTKEELDDELDEIACERNEHYEARNNPSIVSVVCQDCLSERYQDLFCRMKNCQGLVNCDVCLSVHLAENMYILKE